MRVFIFRQLPCPTFIRRRFSNRFILLVVLFTLLTPALVTFYSTQQRDIGHHHSPHGAIYNMDAAISRRGKSSSDNNNNNNNNNNDSPLRFESQSVYFNDPNGAAGGAVGGGGGGENPTNLPTEQKCVVPKLDVNDPVMLNFLKKPDPIRCTDYGNDWITVQNGTLVYSSAAVAKHGDFTCDIHPYHRGNSEDSIVYDNWIRNIPDKSKLTHDYFKIECKTTSSAKKFSQVRHAVADNPDIVARMKKFRAKGVNSGDNPSVLILGFDSMSRMSWLRRVTKTRRFFVDQLGGIELKGYNIMGDGTPAALFPLLTGKHEQEMPEARRNFPGAKPVDGFPWIWKDFKNTGYITAWGDAESNIAPFNMRLLGFKDPPTDYYMRPYLTGVLKEMKSQADHLCQGSIPKHVDWFNRVRDLFYKYGDYPKFVFHFYNSLSHGFDNGIMLADDDLHKLLSDFHSRGYFNHTLVILMGDHGTRFSEVRGTWPGKLEERLPYMSFLFPESFQKKHPDAMTNFKTNVNRLTTPLDIHETLLDFLNMRRGEETSAGGGGHSDGKGDVRNRAISLFQEIPLERSCKHANISSHWCACLEWKRVDTSDKTVMRATNAVVKKINSLTAAYRDLCAELKIEDITSALKLASNKDMLTFKQSKDPHGLVPEFSEQKLNSQEDLYQLNFHTSPSQGYFEATVSHHVTDDVMTVQEKEISRINKYGNASWCVLDKNRQLRQYCYCKEQKKS